MKTITLKNLFAVTMALVAATSAVSTALAQATYEPYAIITFAGAAGAQGSTDGTGSAARFNLPYGVAVDSAGNVHVMDQYNHTIRKITSGGVVSTPRSAEITRDFAATPESRAGRSLRTKTMNLEFEL